MLFRHFRTSFFKLSYLYLSYVTQLYILEPGPSFMVYYNELWSQVWYGDRYRVSFGDRCLLSLCCEEPKSCKISTFSLVYHTWLVDCLVWSAIFTKWARYIITRWTIFYSLFDLSFLLTSLVALTFSLVSICKYSPQLYAVLAPLVILKFWITLSLKAFYIFAQQ